MKKFFLSCLMLMACLTLFAGGAKEGTAVTSSTNESSGPKMAAKQVYYEALFPAAQGEATFITTTGHRFDSRVNEPLVSLTWKGELKNLLAESYDMLENGKVWVMHLRKGVKWHDGATFTATDVIWSYSAYANPRVASRWSGKAASIKGFEDVRDGKTNTLSGVTAIDENTVRIELKEAMPLWLKLEQSFLVIFPEHILGKVAPENVVSDPYWKNRVGTGPFKWSEYKIDQYIKTVKNEDYYLGAPILDEVTYVIFADVPSQLNALASGQIQATAYEGNTIAPQEVATYEAMPNISVVTMNKGSTSFIVPNFNRPEWKDIRVRQAFKYAIDVPSILNAVYPGGITAKSIFPQEWAVSKNVKTYEYNPEKAKQLLKDAGWSGRTVDLVFTQKDSLTRNLLVAVQQYMKAVGVNINLRQVDAAYMTGFYNDPAFDLGFFGNGVGLDPSTAQNLLTTGELLALHYSNAEMDSLFEKGKLETSQAEREKIYQRISEIIAEDLPKIYLWQDIRPLGFSDNVIGPKEHWKEQGTIYFNEPVYNEIEKWYVVE